MDYSEKKYRRFPETTYTFQQIIDSICYDRINRRTLTNYQVIQVHQFLNGHTILREKIWVKIEVILKRIKEENWEKPELIYETRSRRLIVKNKK